MQKKNILLIGFIFLLTFSSCSDWLDVKPKMQVEREELYQSEKGFESALVGCYAKLKRGSLYGKTLTFGDIEYLAQHWIANETYQLFKDFDYGSDFVKNIIETIYKDMYNTIAQTNDLLYYIEKNKSVFADTNSYNLIKGEALAMRAFCHFDILRLFGQLPQQPTQTVQLPYAEIASTEMVPYYPYEEFVEKVIRDYDEAERLLGYSDPILRFSFDELNDAELINEGEVKSDFELNRGCRLNYWAVKALKARTYLYTGNREQAYHYAKEVIDAELDGEPVMELAGKKDLEKKNYSLPSETLFGVHIYNIESVDKSFRGENAYYAATNRNTILNDLFDNISSHNRYTLWTEFFATGTSRMTLKKYWLDEEEDDLAPGESDKAEYLKIIPIIRLSEVYLIAMESTTDLAEANELMETYNRARDVVGIEYDNREMLMQDILKEYQREFFAEGQMFFTYKRVNAKQMLWRTEEVTESNYILPLPDRELKLE